MRQAVGEGGAIVKHVLLSAAASFDGGFERAVIRPVSQDLAFYIGEVGLIRDTGVRAVDLPGPELVATSPCYGTAAEPAFPMAQRR